MNQRSADRSLDDGATGLPEARSFERLDAE